ncbi:MAG: M20/M25/M40 family metallo-hydrolase, partial [Planctomycetota bacterium]
MGAILILAATAFSASVSLADYPESEPQGGRAEQADAMISRYRPAAGRIINAALAHNDAQTKLQDLCLGIGHRMSGSPQLDQAIRWALETMRKDGQENVHPEEVMVSHWVRGAESVLMREPRVEQLAMLGLGGSVGTPAGGIT